MRVPVAHFGAHSRAAAIMESLDARSVRVAKERKTWPDFRVGDAVEVKMSQGKGKQG